MIETRTTWEDSGHDCEHCGGVVWKRTDHLPDGGTEVSFQCRQCSCQWTQAGDWLRVGNGRHCRQAHRQFMHANVEGLWSRRVFIALGVILLLVIVRVGGLGALRFLLPLFLMGFVVWTVVRLLRERKWW